MLVLDGIQRARLRFGSFYSNVGPARSNGKGVFGRLGSLSRYLDDRCKVATPPGC